MGNYVIFLDEQEKPLDYQAVEKALANIGVKAGGWKRLSERDEAYFAGKLCEECYEDDEDDDDEEEEEEDEEEDEKQEKPKLSPLQQKYAAIHQRLETDWYASDDEYGLKMWDEIDGFLNDSHTVFVAPDIPLKKRIPETTPFKIEFDSKYHRNYIRIGAFRYESDYISQALVKIGAISDGKRPRLFCDEEGLLGIGFYRDTAQILVSPRVDD